METEKDVFCDGNGNIKKEIDYVSSSSNQVLEILEAGTFEDLSKRLGLIESDEMLKVRKHIVIGLLKGADTKEDFLEYENLAIKIIDKCEGSDYQKGQIALMIIEASMFHISGYMKHFEDDIEDIIVYAENMHFDDIVNAVKKIKLVI